MDCKEVRKKHYLFVDGELKSTQVQSVKQHIEECPKCGRRIRIERKFKSTIVNNFEPSEAPSELKEKISSEIF
ncbi:MAG: zf-HC2 domain-containing protein [bacterium]